jgi:hypothetical protein
MLIFSDLHGCFGGGFERIKFLLFLIAKSGIIIEHYFALAQAGSLSDVSSITAISLTLGSDERGFLHQEGHEDIRKSHGHEHDHEGCHGAGLCDFELIHGIDEDDA